MSEPRTQSQPVSHDDMADEMLRTAAELRAGGGCNAIEQAIKWEAKAAALRARSGVQSEGAASAWRVCWVSLNTARTELFEDAAKAYAKANETGGCVQALYTSPSLSSANRGSE